MGYEKVSVSLVLVMDSESAFITEKQDALLYDEKQPGQGHEKCISVAGLEDQATKQPGQPMKLRNWVPSNAKGVIVHSDAAVPPSLGASGRVGLTGLDPTETKDLFVMPSRSADPITVQALRAQKLI